MTGLITRWARIVYAYPWAVVIVALAISITGGVLATNIKIKSSFKNLLPDNSQAVKDLDAISERTGGMGTLMVHVAGADLKAMQRFADDLAARLKAYPKEEILFVDHKIDDQKAFFERNKYLYLGVEKLAELKDEVGKYIDKKKIKANPFFVDLSDDDDGEKEEEFDFRAQRKAYEKKYLSKFDKYIDGYLTNEDGTALILVIKTPGSGTGVEFAIAMTDKVEAEIQQLSPSKYHESIVVNLTGELKVLPVEYKALRDDIVIVSNLAVLLVLLAVTLYYRSFRMTAILGIGLLGGVATTFGLVYLQIGYLTAATAFLAAIVAGNGINFGIYFLARYREERLTDSSVVETLARAMRGTVTSVATAAFAAGASYATLMGTQFKGFNQFGFIGGVGMVVCLIYAMSLTPAVAVLMERYLPFKSVSADKYRRGRIFSGTAAWLVERAPRTILAIGALGLIASIVTLIFFLRDPFEYNFRNLRNQYAQDVGSGHISGKAEAILGERSSPHLILADSIDQVPEIKKALSCCMKTNPDEKKRAIKFIKTIYDYLPGSEAEQRKKLALIEDIRQLLLSTDFSSLKDEDQREIRDLTPPENLAVITVDSLPEKLVRPYVELDGTRGTLMLVDMNGSIWNGQVLHRFAGVVREIKLANNDIVRSSGKVVIFSDMIRYVTNEGPYATAAAFVLVLLVIVVAFRKYRHVVVMALSMASGVVLMMGVAVALGQKINFLNYIAIPIQFGIGVDYSVNIYSRFMQEGPGSIGRVLRSTGGAVMITSTTTIIGYGAMWFSINGAINSFGTLANIGEVTCLLSATLLLPAYLAVFRKGLVKQNT